MDRCYRVAYLVSHPIQYQAPLLRYIAENSSIDLTTFFLSDFSTRNYRDAGFGTSIQWDTPLLGGYKYVFLPSIGRSDQISFLRPLSYGLWRYLRSGKFDAIWLHGYAQFANLRAIVIAKALGMKVLIRAESQLGSAIRTPANRVIKEAVIQRLFAKIDAFLAIGTLNREYYCCYGVSANKIFSMPYAVDNGFFEAKAKAAHQNRESLRAELCLTPERPVILYASKLVSRKRAGDLLEAYIRLSPDGLQEPYPYLLFVGDGEERLRLEARVKQLGWSSVRFLGFKNQTELPAYYDLCNVFVLVSEREPWGLIVNEVMNAGKPVVLSNQVGSAADLVRDGENGYVVPVGDIAALSDRIRRVICQPEAANQMGKRSLELIRQWGFREDLTGLKEALEATLGR